MTGSQTNETLSREMLINLLHETQKENHDLHSESKRLKRRLNQVTDDPEDEHDSSDDEDDDGASKRQKIQSQKPDEDPHRELGLLARKFASTEMLWLRDLNKTFDTVLDEKYQEHKRFTSNKRRLQGQLRALLSFLPDKYHGILNTQTVKDTFRTHMQVQRSNTVTRVRSQCGQAIFDCSIEDLADANRRKIKFRDAIGWNESEKMYERWNCSILHENGCKEGNSDLVFRSQTMLRCYAAIFFGTNAVAAFRANQFVGRGKETVIGVWGLTHTTPGSIAMCAVITRWAVSEDYYLQEYGKRTMIDWQQDFESYLMYLLNGIRQKKVCVVELFQLYDEIFFPGTSSEGGHGAVVRKNLDDQDAEMMDMLNQGEEIEVDDRQSDDEEDDRELQVDKGPGGSGRESTRGGGTVDQDDGSSGGGDHGRSGSGDSSSDGGDHGSNSGGQDVGRDDD
ncbi:hypothetical protein K435DRAFT_871077 [Dendrothele bispora CBS 962.96]|uniref:Uncharacterized protein n=1 Tax=Dendrothele bispora (strain CBS 962.96) TaxID=1314807 RepID=A0A4S8L4Z1_DENBC|nr:hypothetical protein K435DRAFT_871077 [Dendrothele bispora CBS 962.96]